MSDNVIKNIRTIKAEEVHKKHSESGKAKHSKHALFNNQK